MLDGRGGVPFKYHLKQDRAKKVLSVAIYNHYKRMKYGFEHKDDMTIEKSNVIMLGPSGCGKTALLSHLSTLLDIPAAAWEAALRGRVPAKLLDVNLADDLDRSGVLGVGGRDGELHVGIPSFVSRNTL